MPDRTTVDAAVTQLRERAATELRGDTLPLREQSVFAAAGQLTTAVTGSTSTPYTFDARGDRTKATAGTTVATYGYDQVNRLTSFARGTTTASYTYNGDGLRASKKVGSTTTKFVYDTAEGLPLVLGDGAYYYLYGPGGIPFEQITTAGTVTYLHADQLGSIRMITSSTGTSVGTATYTAYGTRTTTGTTSAFGYAGQYTDTETGLQWLRARYYDPATGQFLTVDPLTAATGARYAYATGNPITRADPSGLCDWVSNVGGGLFAAASSWVATHTIGVCVTGAAGFVGFVSGTRCVVISGGDLAMTKTVGVGGSSPTASLSAGLVFSNARKPDQLAGWFYGGGASVDIGPSVGDDFVVGKDSCGANIWTNDLHVGVGIDGIPAEGHLNATYTQVEKW